MPSNLAAAFLRGGGASAPPSQPSASPFQAPSGIPVPEMMTGAMGQQGQDQDQDGLLKALRVGAVGAEQVNLSAQQLLQLISLLAGLGNAPVGGAPQPSVGGSSPPPGAELAQTFLGR